MEENDEICRICFKKSTPGNQHKWLDLDDFIPIIQLLARTKIFNYEGSPKRICGSCSNGILMANIFRIKIIESNAFCQNLCVKENDRIMSEERQFLSKSITLAEDSMIEEYLDEPFLEIIGNQKGTNCCLLQGTQNKMKYIQLLNQENKLSSCKSLIQCCLCKIEVKWLLTEPVQLYSDTLSKIKILNNFTIEGRVCKECRVNVKNAENHFQQIVQPPQQIKDRANFCQFCFKRCRQINKASVEMVSIYMSLSQPIYHRNVLVGGRVCATCVKNLRCLKDLYNYLIKLQVSNKHSRGKSLNINETVPIDELLTNYECHMSDIEESESDISMPEVLFGEPLNNTAEQQRFKCNSCIYSFVDHQKLEAHIIINHKTQSKTCDICDQNFPSIQACKQHKCRVHFFSLYDGYYKKLCHFCGLTTKQLEPHISTHTNSKPFSCDLCNHQSRSKVRIKDHILAVHTKERRYKCNYCGKGFSYYSDKNRHEISAHTKQYKYVCEICKKCFLKKNFLKAHQDSHEGVFLKQIE